MPKDFDKYRRNPFSDLINSFIHGYKFTVEERWDSHSPYFLDPELQKYDISLKSEIEKLLVKLRTFTIYSSTPDYIAQLGYPLIAQELIDANIPAVNNSMLINFCNQLLGRINSNAAPVSIQSEDYRLPVQTEPDVYTPDINLVPQGAQPNTNYINGSQEEVEQKINQVLFNNIQHETTDGYYLTFLPSGGKAIYVPTQWALHEQLTIIKWDTEKDTFNRYCVIVPSWKQGIPIYDTGVQAFASLGWKYFPILPHLAYVEYNEQWWEDYLWVLSFKDPYVNEKNTVFRWEQYYENRRW